MGFYIFFGIVVVIVLVSLWPKYFCSKGKSHDWVYKDWGITYQEKRCKKCGIAKIVSK